MKLRVSWFLLVAALFATRTVQGEEEVRWQGHGPWGGLIFRYQVDPAHPRRHLVMTSQGHYLSRDDGETWSRLTWKDGPAARAPVSFLDGRLVCTHDGKILRSLDGRTWTPEGHLGSQVRYFAPGGWCCFIEQPRVGLTHVRLARWKKSDWRWKRVSVELYGRPVEALGGMQYRDLFLVHPSRPEFLRVFCLALAPATRMTVLGSDDGGKYWDHWSTDTVLNAAVFDPRNPKVIYGAAIAGTSRTSGFVRSADGGRTWKKVTGDERTSSLRTIALHGPKHLLLGSLGHGLLTCRLDGSALRRLGTSSLPDNVAAIATHPKRPDVVLIGCREGLFRSQDRGKSFAEHSAGIGGLQMTGLEVLPGDPERICLFEFHQGMRISEDNGKTWTPAVQPWPGRTHSVLRSGTRLFVDSGEGVIASDDRGETFKQCATPPESGPVGVDGAGGIYVADRSGRLYLCGGEPLPKPLTGPLGRFGRIERVVAFPSARVLLIVADRGALRCDAKTGRPLAGIAYPEKPGVLPWSARPDPGREGIVYFGRKGGGLLELDVGKGTWRSVLELPGQFFWGFSADPTNPKRRFAGFSDGYLAVSTDEGRTWKEFDAEAGFGFIRRVAVTSDGRLVVAGDGTVRTIRLP